MAEHTFVLFKRTKEVETKISEFLSNIVHSGFLFALGFEIYLSKGKVPSSLSGEVRTVFPPRLGPFWQTTLFLSIIPN